MVGNGDGPPRGGSRAESQHSFVRASMRSGFNVPRPSREAMMPCNPFSLLPTSRSAGSLVLLQLSASHSHYAYDLSSLDGRELSQALAIIFPLQVRDDNERGCRSSRIYEKLHCLISVGLACGIVVGLALSRICGHINKDFETCLFSLETVRRLHVV